MLMFAASRAGDVAAAQAHLAKARGLAEGNGFEAVVEHHAGFVQATV